jgi:hypothetical protein
MIRYQIKHLVPILSAWAVGFIWIIRPLPPLGHELEVAHDTDLERASYADPDLLQFPTCTVRQPLKD